MNTVFLSIGSNLGDRALYVQTAVNSLNNHKKINISQQASILESDPVGGPDGQGKYLNTVIEIATELDQFHLLKFCQNLEEAAGRKREIKWGPRTLDIDILIFNNLIQDSPILIIPHPEMHYRRFVLQPLSEIAPELIHPVLGISVSKILNNLNK